MRGHRSKGRPHPYTVARSQPSSASGSQVSSPVDGLSTGDSPYKCWNEDTLSQWLGLENLGSAFLDGVQTWVLVDNCARVISIMTAYIHKHNLEVCPISNLDHSLNPFQDRIPLVGLDSNQTEPIGFILVRMQIEGMPHYDKQQVTFVLDNPNGF